MKKRFFSLLLIFILLGSCLSGSLFVTCTADAADAPVFTEIVQGNFDSARYAKDYPDLQAAFGNNAAALWNHYLHYGIKENRTAYTTDGARGIALSAANFDTARYAADYADLKAAFGADEAALWNHYNNFGRKERRVVYTKSGQRVIAAASSSAPAPAAPAAADPAATPAAAPVASALSYGNIDLARYAKDYPDARNWANGQSYRLYAHLYLFGVPQGRQIHSTDPVLEQILTGSDPVAKSNLLKAWQESFFRSTPPANWNRNNYSAAQIQQMRSYIGSSIVIGSSVAETFARVASSKNDPVISSPLHLAQAGYLIVDALSENDAYVRGWGGASGTQPVFRGAHRAALNVIAEGQYNTVFIQLGMIDAESWSILDAMAPGHSPVAAYLSLIAKIRQKAPGSKIIVLAATPFSSAHGASQQLNVRVAAFNAAMRTECAKAGVPFVDVTTNLITGDGWLKPEICTDNYIHIQPDAYENWLRVIKAYIASQLGF
ncbi:MAG: SGNH/GDSL hydrolase family protein [Lachnospiraceae bacterium]|nr:SGNH/GDSL hydrolase family protein [Lachnospiraceae bacterium]